LPFTITSILPPLFTGQEISGSLVYLPFDSDLLFFSLGSAVTVTIYYITPNTWLLAVLYQGSYLRLLSSMRLQGAMAKALPLLLMSEINEIVE